MKRTGTAPNRRSGVAAVELAACLPVILILTLGTLQACALFYVKQSLSVAAYEGVRACIEHNATEDQVKSAAEGILADRNVKNARVRISPSDFTSQARESWITVTVIAPCNANAPLRGWFYPNRTLRASATMMKEF